MFSRDSQFSRHNSKLSRNSTNERSADEKKPLAHHKAYQDKAYPDKAYPDNVHPDNVRQDNAHYSKPMSAKSPSETLGEKLGEPEKLEIETARSHSWQIAPNLFTSFKYAWAGISYAFKTQRNFRVHTGVGTIAILLCWALHVSNLEIAIICLTIGAVLVMEILNTALESLVDLTVGQTYHDLAKIAKDCAAGAVLMAAIVAILIAALIFIPPLWATIQNHIV